MEYSSDEMKQMLDLKEDIVECCSECNGTGFILKDGYDHTCNCIKLFRYIRKLKLSGISSEYWTLNINKLTLEKVYETLLKTYIKNLEVACKKGLGLFLFGSNGVGKTTMLSEIGKWGLAKGFSVQYLTQERYMQWISPNSNNELLLNRLENAQVILLDELGKGYIKNNSNYVPAKIEEFIRRKLAEGVALSASSNYDLDQLEEMLGSSTISSMERHLKFVEVEGTDQSSKKQDSWLVELETSFDYYNSTLLKLAKRMHISDDN